MSKSHTMYMANSCFEYKVAVVQPTLILMLTLI